MPPRGARVKAPSRKRTIDSEIGEIVLESDCEKAKPPKKRKPNERRRPHAKLEPTTTWFQIPIANDLWMPETMELEHVQKANLSSPTKAS
jgi:hypothetical protein